MRKSVFTLILVVVMAANANAGILRNIVNVFRVQKHPQRTTQTEKQPVQTKKAEIIPHEEEAWHKLDPEEKQFIAELDQLRAKMGLPQIIVVDKIVEDSRNWSAYLRRTNRFYHGNPTLENIAMGHEDGDKTFRQWRASAGHNAKLCNRNDTVCGIGRCGNYWTYRAASSIDVYYTGKDPNMDIPNMVDNSQQK